MNALRHPLLAVAGAAAAIAALLFYPMRHGHAYLDDFVFIALARQIDNPLVLLVQDSLGAFFFRPVAMFLWWTTVAALGNDAPAHLLFNMGVHAVNGVLVYALLRQLRFSFWPAAAAGILFIAHPAAFSAAAWLSDRFDLFATLFGTAALIATDRFLERPTRGSLAAAALALLAALFSKETGVAFAAAAALHVLWRAPPHHVAARRDRVVVFVAIVACTLVAIGVRPLVLRNFTEAMLLRDGVVATLWGGTWKWITNLPGFVVVMQGRGVAVGLWVGLLLALVIANVLPATRAALGSRGIARAMLMGAAIAAASALAQAPVVHASAIPQYSFAPYTAERTVFAPLEVSRFYYVAIAGLALVGGAAAQAVAWAALARGARILLALLAAATLAGMVATDRGIAREWMAFVERGDAPVIRAAVEVLAGKRDAPPGCKVYLLETARSSPRFATLMDTAVKQALPRGHPLVGCFIQGEHTPWYHLVATANLPSDAEKPLEIMQLGGKPYPPLAVGNLSYFYLNAADRPELLDDPLASFYAYAGGRFVDVTADVRSRKRAVKFVNNRPPL